MIQQNYTTTQQTNTVRSAEYSFDGYITSGWYNNFVSEIADFEPEVRNFSLDVSSPADDDISDVTLYNNVGFIDSQPIPSIAMDYEESYEENLEMMPSFAEPSPAPANTTSFYASYQPSSPTE